MARNKHKIINDPVFGFITIPSDLCYELLQTRWMNRLSRIKQLGLTSYVYPGTQHTRFQHSIGALFLMTQAINVLRSKDIEITEQEADAVYAAILLHDIGHGPFSHTLEHFFFPEYSHEEVGMAIIEQLNKEMNGALDMTIDILRNKHPKKFLKELVSGQLDMDRLDYIRRDSFFSGVSEGNIGSARIIKMLNIKDGKLVVEAKGIYSIENFLLSRRLMYWQVYFHKTAYGAEKMLKNTLIRAKELKLEGKDIYCTPPMQFFLSNKSPELNDESLAQFLSMDDSDIWTAMKSWAKCDDKVLTILSNSILNRQIFKTEIDNKPIDAAHIDEVRARIADKFGLSIEEAGYLTLYGTMSQNIYKIDEADIDILYNDGSVKTIQAASDMFDIDLLSKKVTKHYFCHYRV